MADRDDRLLVAPLPFDAMIAGLQGRALAARGRRGRLEPRRRASTGCPCASSHCGACRRSRSGPGHMAPQLHRCAAAANRVMSPPVSATMLMAPMRSMPGIVSRPPASARKGEAAIDLRRQRPIVSSRKSIFARICSMRNAWCGRNRPSARAEGRAVSCAVCRAPNRRGPPGRSCRRPARGASRDR